MINDGFEPLFDSVFVNSDYEELDDDVDDNTDSLASLRNDDDSGNSESEDEEEQNGCDNDEIDAEWSNVVVARENSPLDESSLGFQSDIMLTCKDPVDFYELFMVDVWELIVKETNIYGYQKHPGWEPITMEDMKKFIGLCLQMGIVQLPHLKNYWSNNPAFGKYPIGPDVMSRERFEKILTHLHLADNSNYDGSDRLFKISRLIELINRNCKAVCRPGKEVYINRSMPFTGRVLFRQCTPHKKLRYDVKLFKLCSERGYTYKMLAYADKNHNRAGHLAERVVMTLMDDLLDEGRHLYIDKWFTSVSLAESLLRRNTYLTGMCKKNRIGLPKDIIQRKLSKGQWAAKQKENGVMVLRWKDTQDIIILSTAHDISLIPNTSKPEVVESYRKRKASMDSSAQMTSYSPYSTRSNKWHVYFVP
ncbi:hypothetical protein KIN20_038418 [Parelaphostrongylus tenuis]|uniref:PiggyBac transposable element-derived protein domain-containing protein n=1 Tax=Parelaphostrongylus tenuis TaxID=148309 RepID=A0AAD5N5R8_PARTN|nr:hypothetical protein KIN20_038418 [Parelaphostrongylus tenuis]